MVQAFLKKNRAISIKKKKLKAKKCKVCSNTFNPWNSTQVVCQPDCAIAYTRTRKQKEEKKKSRKAVLALRENDRGFRLAQAQVWFNKFIRLRDDKEPCISCQRHHQGQYHAGHYRSRGAAPELRFNEDNCHKQCSACNNMKSGNLIPYRVNLVKKIGQEKVDFIEGNHPPKKYSIEEIKAIEMYYKQQCKELKTAVLIA